MYTHLRLHTEFSVTDGTVRIDEAVQAALQDGAQPALAITDLANLFGTVKFYKEARKNGIKPLIGADVWVQSPQVDGHSGSAPAPSRLLLLVQNHTGYLHLCELLSRAWTANTVRGQPVIELAWLQTMGEGLIALSGAHCGAVGLALLQGDTVRADACALQLAAIFPGRFYIELQRAGQMDDARHVPAAVQLAARLGLPVVATHPVQFLRYEDYEAHEARVCISEGEILGNAKRVRKFTREQYFKSSAQMQALFADIPSALANTVEIAKRCSLSLSLGKPMLPDYPTPMVDGVALPIAAYFRQACIDGLTERMNFLYPDASVRAQKQATYDTRLEFEVATILKMGFPGYFLIVGDFINWAKNNDCPVGPGRGSGAGSLVAYALKITDLDPLKYNLLFERFLNPERVSMPDFDIDFCQQGRDRVIDYVKTKYGREAVSQIVTFGTMAARAAIRDVGRVLDFSYGFCDSISKLIPNKPGQPITIAKAKEVEPILAERERKEEDVRTLLELAQKLEGLTRNVGMHAGGVLIAPGRLTDFCPLYAQPGSSSAVSQYDKDDVEDIGLVKFDFLGLATLTILEMARKMIVARYPDKASFSFDDIKPDDKKDNKAVFELFSRGQTEAVFQFESVGMQRMLKDAKPDRLEDLIAMNALYRPGPMELIPTYIARKQGKEVPEYPDPRVEAILQETYGIMVYQEQVMQTAQILGGYSLGGADLLRRAMGKKKKEEMDAQRAVFRTGAGVNGLSAVKADEVFDLMEKFAGYGFNKSHSAAYALLAYQTAWLKVRYTAEFFAANMTVEMDDTDKLRVLFADAQKMNLTFEVPDINDGNYRFEPVNASTVRYGLGAVKGTGQQAIEAIVAARTAGGRFTSLFDFCVRVDRSKYNKRTVEALIKAGAFDKLESNRASLLASTDRAFDFAIATEANANQCGLFDMDSANAHAASSQEPPLVGAMPFGIKARLVQEKTAVGFYLSGHLFDEVASEVRQFLPQGLDALEASREPQWLAGIVSDLRIINGNRGKLVIFNLDDKLGCVEASVDEALLQMHRELLKDDEFIVAKGVLQAGNERFGQRFKVTQVLSLEAARCEFGRFLQVNVSHSHEPDIAALVHKFAPRRDASALVTGDTPLRSLPVRLSVLRNGAAADMVLGDAARFFPSDAALAGWMAQAEAGQARIVYGNSSSTSSELAGAASLGY